MGEWKREKTLMRGRKRRREERRGWNKKIEWDLNKGAHGTAAERTEERLAGVIRCEKRHLRQLCSQTLHVSFYKAPRGFFGFSKQFAKNTTATLGENARRGSWIKRPDQSFKPSPSKLNDMHLIPVSPNKAVKERFHKLWSVSGKSMMTPPI